MPRPVASSMSPVHLPAAAEPRISIASGETRGMSAIHWILPNRLRDRAGKLISAGDGFEVAMSGRNVTRYEIYCGDKAASPSGLGVRRLAPQHHLSPAIIHVQSGGGGDLRSWGCRGARCTRPRSAPGYLNSLLRSYALPAFFSYP